MQVTNPYQNAASSFSNTNNRITQKFTNGYPDKLDFTQLQTLEKLDVIFSAITKNSNAISYEQRLTNFDHNTKKATGELKTVMVKIKIDLCGYPDMDTFVKEFFVPLIRRLERWNFDQLVCRYGQTVTDGATAYLELVPFRLTMLAGNPILDQQKNPTYPDPNVDYSWTYPEEPWLIDTKK